MLHVNMNVPYDVEALNLGGIKRKVTSDRKQGPGLNTDYSLKVT